MLSAQEFILERVQQVPWSGCWLWDRYLDPCGYGRFGKTAEAEVLAHRYSYLAFVGSIPRGSHVCHTCDVLLGNRESGGGGARRPEKPREDAFQGGGDYADFPADEFGDDQIPF